MLAHRRRMAHCQAFGNPLVAYRGPAFHQRGAHHLSGIALSELFSCLLVVQLLHMDKRSNHPTKMQIPVISFIQDFRAGNTSRSSPLNWENALSVVIIWNPERMAKAAK